MSEGLTAESVTSILGGVLAGYSGSQDTRVLLMCIHRAFQVVADAENEAARREAVETKVCRYGNDCPDVGGPCPACDGTGSQDDGDPEVGQMLIDCDRCKGTGKTAADLVARIKKRLEVSGVVDAELALTVCAHLTLLTDEKEFQRKWANEESARANAAAAAIEALRAERDADIDDAKDEAANFCIVTLSKALGVEAVAENGTETWDGDVAATIYGALRRAGVLDENDDTLVTVKLKAAEARVAALEDGMRRISELPSAVGVPITTEAESCFGMALSEAHDSKAIPVEIRPVDDPAATRISAAQRRVVEAAETAPDIRDVKLRRAVEALRAERAKGDRK